MSNKWNSCVVHFDAGSFGPYPVNAKLWCILVTLKAVRGERLRIVVRVVRHPPKVCHTHGVVADAVAASLHIRRKYPLHCSYFSSTSSSSSHSFMASRNELLSVGDREYLDCHAKLAATCWTHARNIFEGFI